MPDKCNLRKEGLPLTSSPGNHIPTCQRRYSTASEQEVAGYLASKENTRERWMQLFSKLFPLHKTQDSLYLRKQCHLHLGRDFPLQLNLSR